MLKNIKISTKITLIILILSLVAVTAISFFTYEYNLNANQEKVINNLNAIADSRAEQLNAYFEKLAIGVSVIQQSDKVKGESPLAAPDAGGFDLTALMDVPSTESDSVIEESTSDTDPVESYLFEQKEKFGFDQLYILSSNGNILQSTDQAHNSGNFVDPDGLILDRGKQGTYFSTVIKEKNKYLSYIAAPIQDDTGTRIIVAKVDLSEAYKPLNNYQGLGQTGEVILARHDPVSNKVIFVSPLRGEKDAALKLFEAKDKSVEIIEGALMKGKLGEAPDYKGKETFQVARKLSRDESGAPRKSRSG